MRNIQSVLVLVFVGLGFTSNSQIRREYWTDFQLAPAQSEHRAILYELSARANSDTYNYDQFLGRVTGMWIRTDYFQWIGGVAGVQNDLGNDLDYLYELRPFIGARLNYSPVEWLDLSLLLRNEVRINFLSLAGDFQYSTDNRFRARPELHFTPFIGSVAEQLEVYTDYEWLMQTSYSPGTFLQEVARWRVGLKYPLSEKWTIEGSYFREFPVSTFIRYRRDVFRLAATYDL